MNFDLYVIISGATVREMTPCGIAERAIAGGADIIQLREKGGDACRLLRSPKGSGRSPGKVGPSSS